jgi:SAM-dependent methyltransferase
MNGTAPQKIARLATDLAFHPQYVGRYLQHNLRQGQTPLDLELPFFSYAAIDFLRTYLQPDMSVFEFGSGGSTLFFAQLVKCVTSVENSGECFDEVVARVKEKNLVNVEIKLRPFNAKDPRDFEESEYLQSISGETFDVIVIDGAEEWTPVRPLCFRHAEQWMKPGGIIVVDDSWRYAMLHAEHHAKRFKIFRSVGPCRPGVTSTDIFFY